MALFAAFASVAVFASSASVALPAAPPSFDRVPLDELLDRAAWYLDYFVDEFENVVAEESYIQDSAMLLPSFSPMSGGRGGAFPPPPSPTDAARARHRDLRSDFLLVKAPDSEALVPFRDVLEVDGVPVRDREARLARLFLAAPGASAMEQAEKIGAEGARYNLGNMRSTLGNPVLGLGVLQRTYQRRFRFSLGKEDRTTGAPAAVVEFKETASPAMIRGEAGRDLMAHGRIWIDAPTGRVLKTELQVEQPAIRASVTTTFRLDEKSGIGVPAEMRELYALANGNRISTVATYGRFRHFDVRASEEISTPIAALADEWTGMTLVELPPGRFTMGSASSEAGRNDDEMLHDVEITHPFFIGQFEVTQQEWRTVMGTSPSHFSACGQRCPVENVTFAEVQQFLTRLNAHVAPPQSKAPSLRYRLPTEAEWEYACRARTTGPFYTGESLTTTQANYNGRFPYGSSPAGEFRQKTTPAGSFPLNPWGLGDMHGNVWEWTSDWYSAYSEAASANIDPHGPPAGEKRVIRGGSWYFDANSARCALRYTHAPQDKGFSLGFRVAADRMR
ncbi:MAG TPA: formylglycine-generating enzyme family protein [Vicinamibacterales bacterium]|nr:formylglycine-generating enzyme family protein [Vicinamibacterales bacterium]